MRGKIGGLVASRAIGGTTLKAQVVPRRSGSLMQQQRRSTFYSALQAWRALTVANRNSWTTGAYSLTWQTSLGVLFVPTGLQLWQQAFVNAALLNLVPPATYTGSPSDIAPIVQATLTGAAGEYVLLVNPYSGTYTGTWLAFMSAIIPVSKNYTLTLSRKFCGGNTGGNEVLLSTDWENIWGPLPAPGPIVGMRVLPIHPDSYVSGTVYIAPVPFQS